MRGMNEMIVIRDCCDHVPPVIANDVFGGIFVYCPVCGYTVHDQTLDEALSKWNDYRNGVKHE